MQFSRWSHEIVALVFLIAVFAVAFNNASPNLTGMIVSEEHANPDEYEQPAPEGCEYVEVPYTENLCTDYRYNYTIRHDKFINSRYGDQYVCTGSVIIESQEGSGTWILSYVFDIDGRTYKAENITNYIIPGKPGVFIFEHLCDEDTEFDGIYVIEEEPVMKICGPATMYRKEVKC